MKTYTSDWLDAIAAGDGVAHGAVKIAPIDGDPLLFWGGYGDLVLDAGDGDETYVGVGDKGLVTVSGGKLGSSENAIELSLSGVDPDVAMDGAIARDAPVIIWRLGFDSSGRNLLDATIFTRGKLDDLYREETVGGTATIRAMVESAARGSGRASGRMRTDADQRLIREDDLGFVHIAYAGMKSLYWGGKKPLRRAGVPSTGLPG